MLLALLGSAIGIGIIYLMLDGLRANSNFLTGTQYAFTFVVSTEVMGQGVLWAAAIGLLSGFSRAASGTNASRARPRRYLTDGIY